MPGITFLMFLNTKHQISMCVLFGWQIPGKTTKRIGKQKSVSEKQKIENMGMAGGMAKKGRPPTW
jgi:hypothetical protein